MTPLAQPGSVPIQSPPPGVPPYDPYQVPYGPPGPPFYPPPQKSSNVVLIVVIVVIVVFLISIVATAVLYVLVTGLIGEPPPSRPVVTFSAPTIGGANVTFNVASTSQGAPFDQFRANLLVNTTAGTPRIVAPVFTIEVGGETYTVSYTDSDQDTLLSRGDVFLINAGNGWRRGVTYQFMLQWTDGSVTGFSTWVP